MEENVSTSHPRRRYTVFVFAAVVLIGGIVAGFMLTKPSPSTESVPPSVSETGGTQLPQTGGATLSFGQATVASDGADIAVPVTIDTGGFTVSAVEIGVQVDPSVASPTRFEPGAFFRSPQILAQKIDAAAGTLEVSIGSIEPMATNGTIGSIHFRLSPSASETLTLQFTKDTHVAATGETRDILLEKQSGSVRIPL